MRNTIDPKQLRRGMQVQSGEGQALGAIERTDADSITVKGQQYEFSSIERIEGDRVFLTRQVGASTDAGRGQTKGSATEADDDVRIQVREERLEVGKRERQTGEVEVRTRVESEQQTVPVELTREEVHVEQRDVADRPATEADLQGAFREGTIRVPVRGEEAVAHKETVVTGEVVIDKERTTRTEQVSDTVRRETIDVDESGVRAPAAPQTSARATAAPAAPERRAATPSPPAQAQTRPQSPKQAEVAEGMEVTGSDGAVLGVVKEVRASDFQLDRSGQRDLYVPLSAIAGVRDGRVALSVESDEVDDQGWPNPSLF